MTLGNDVRAAIGLDGLALVAIGDIQRLRLNMYLEKEDEALNLLQKRMAEKTRGVQ